MRYTTNKIMINGVTCKITVKTEQRNGRPTQLTKLESPEELSPQIDLGYNSSGDPISVYDLLFLFEV